MSSNVEHLPDRKRLAEEQVAQAVATLREKMPENFMLVYQDADGVVQVMGAFSLSSAQAMLDTAIKAVAEQYAYQTAKAAKP